MENNQILISIHFITDSKNWTEPAIELMIPRDATLIQLLDSVKYGLKKQVKLEKKAASRDDSVLSFEECLKIYDLCRAETAQFPGAKEGVRYWTHIQPSLYDRGTLEKNELHTIVSGEKKRVVILTSDGEKKLCDLGFISASRLIFCSGNMPETHEVDTGKIGDAFRPGNEKSDIRYPRYNISTRQLQCYDSTPVEILPPPEPPKKPQQNLWTMLLPTLLSVGMMTLIQGVLVRSSVGGGTGTMVLMSVGMGVVTLITTLMSWSRQKKNYKQERALWEKRYGDYVVRVIEKIRKRQKKDAETLNRNYPGAMQLLEDVCELNDDIFSRSPAQEDFLTVRLGTSKQVENLFEIKGKGKDTIFSPATFELVTDGPEVEVKMQLLEETEDGGAANADADHYISNLPAKIAEKNRYMSEAPFLYSLRKCGALGLVYDDPNRNVADIDSPTELFIRRMIFELCYYHSPEDLQFVIFFPDISDRKKMERYVESYAHLPHCRDLFENKSQFVFSKRSANLVLSSMLKIMEERSGSGVDAVTTPHIVFIVFEEYNLKEHAFASFLPAAPKAGTAYQNRLGLTFVFAKRYKEHLPEYCTDVITLSHNSDYTITPYTDREKKKTFSCETSQRSRDPQKELRTFRMLSSIYYTRISQNRQVPSSVSLFQQFGIRVDGADVHQSLTAAVRANWGLDDENKRVFDVTKTLAVPIGMTDSDAAILDLHEKADGPHMLVAGTTGSGKSETIISYLIGLCMRFRPDEVSMLLVDMKGGGFTKRLGELPHVVGKVTDIDGDENETGAEYMLKRFLNAIQSEVKRRKLVINHFPNVDSIDGYIKKCREIRASASPSEDDVKYISEHPLTHLFLVVDEFTELKRFSSENSDINYMSEITTIARIGRSLGIHIILISQNIEGAITDDIRVNSKSRLCLKVATKQASREMIGNDLAAAPSMPGNGRAYLLVGTGSKFEYFQSAYSGVLASENTSSDLTVVNAEKEGEYTRFYYSYEDNDEIIAQRKSNRETQLKVTVDAICSLYSEMNAAGELPPKRVIFRDPLPLKVTYDPKYRP